MKKVIDNKDNIQQVGLINIAGKAKFENETSFNIKAVFKTILGKINIFSRYKKMKKSLDNAVFLEKKNDELLEEVERLKSKLCQFEDETRFVPNAYHKNILKIIKDKKIIDVEQFREDNIDSIDEEIAYSELVDNSYIIEFHAQKSEFDLYGYLAAEINPTKRTEILKIIKE